MSDGYTHWKERLKNTLAERCERITLKDARLMLYDVIEKMSKKNTWAKCLLLENTHTDCTRYMKWSWRLA